MAEKRSVKGTLKDYNRWLADELEDYAQSPVLENKIFKLDALSMISDVAEPLEYLVGKYPKAKQSTEKQESDRPNLNYLETLKKCPVEYLLRFLSLKDFPPLLRVSKEVKLIFDSPKAWMILGFRDFMDLRSLKEEVNLISPKKIYRFLLFMEKSRIIYHSANFLNIDGHRSSLIENMTDVIPLYNKHMKHLVSEIVSKQSFVTIRNTRSFIDDLNVSISKDRNQVRIWLGGWYFARKLNQDQEEKKTSISHGLLKQYLPKYKRLQSAFFVSDTFLVIETKTASRELNLIIEDSQEKNVSNTEEKNEEKYLEDFKENEKSEESTFLFVNLLQDFGNKMEYSPFEVVLRKSGATFVDRIAMWENPILNDHRLFIELQSDYEKEISRDSVIIKMLGDNEVVFVTRESRNPSITILNIKAKKEIFKTTIELDSPLYDIVIYKIKKDREGFRIFIIGKTCTVSYIDVSKEKELLTTKLIFKPLNDIGKDSIQSEAPGQKHFDLHWDSRCKYVHGSYNLSEVETPSTREHLIINNHNQFCLIDLEDVKKYEFFLPDVSEEIYNWTAYEDKLVILGPNWISVYQFSVETHSVREVQKICPGKGFLLYRSYSYWIVVAPCYTALIRSNPFDNNRNEDFHIEIIFTEILFSNAYDGLNLNPYVFKVNNFLSDDDIQEIEKKGNIEIRLLEQKLFLKTSSHSFFINFEAFRLSKKVFLNGFFKEEFEKLEFEKLDFSVMKELVQKPEPNAHLEELKGENQEDEAKKKIKLHYLRIPENNNIKTRKDNIWNQKEKCEQLQNQRKINKAIRSNKYFKNVRQKERSEKQI